MTSEIRTNSLKSRAGLSTVTFTDSGPMFSGITTFVDNSGFNIGTGSSIFSPATNTFTLGTNSAERLRIDSNGNIGVGIAPSSGARLWIATNDNPFVGTRYNAGADGSVLFLQHSRSNTIGTNVALNDNDEVGTVQFRAYASNNSSVKVAASIKAEVNGTTGTGGVPTDLIFATGTNSSNATEKLRITSGGKIGIGSDNPNRQMTIVDAAGGGIGVIGTNAGIVLGTNHTGSFAVNAAIARAAATNYHITNSSVGDLCIGAESTKSILFGTGATAGAMAERLRIKANGTVNIGTNNQASGDSSSKLRVGQAAGSDVGIVVIGNADSTTPALVITNWDGSQASNKSLIHFDNSGWGSHQIGSLAGSDGFGIYDDSVLRMSINNAGNTTFHTTGHIVLPSGTTAQRVNTAGAFRYNSGNGNLEFYNGTSWRKIQLISYAPTNGLIAYWPFSSSSRSGTTYNDDSGNNYHLTVYGTITDDTTETKFNGCIDFGTADGIHYLKSSSNSFADLDSTSGYSGVSISVWVKTTVTNNYQQWIISEGTVNQRWNYFVENATGPKWRSVGGGDITMSGSMMTGNWHHLVVTYNSSNNLVQHYRDGSFTNQGTTNNPVFNGEYLLVGQHSVLGGDSSSYRWRGKMAHMRIYNRVLSSSEVSLLYNEW